MTSAYTDFPKEPCPNMSSPCWIPQADSIIQKHTIHSLHQCDTIEKYKCMLNTIRYAKDKIDQQCKKPCKTETYTTNSLRNDLFPLWRVSRKSVLKYSVSHYLDYFRTAGNGEYMSRQSMKASLFLCTKMHMFMTSMQLSHQLEGLSDSF